MPDAEKSCGLQPGYHPQNGAQPLPSKPKQNPHQTQNQKGRPQHGLPGPTPALIIYAGALDNIAFGLAKRRKPALYPALAGEHGCAPFVYRLGREIFNLERGVRLP